VVSVVALRFDADSPPVGAVAASEQGEVDAFDAIQTPVRERRIPAR